MTFRETWNSEARRVRNLLEHEEEYLAGVGQFQSQISSEAADAPRVLTWVAGRVLAIEVLGHSLNLRGHIDRAVGMEADLREVFGTPTT